jgi:hypothetical protein
MDRGDLISAMRAGVDFLGIVIDRKQVDVCDIRDIDQTFYFLTEDAILGRHFREKVDISFSGYDNRAEELWEIPEVRNYIQEIDNKYPYWLYFMSKNRQGLHVVLKCFLLPYLTKEAEKKVNGPMLQEYLEKRGFPACNRLCSKHQISGYENEQMTNRLLKYLHP